MRIWKYPLKATDRQAITMPPGAKLLTVQVQYGKCCLWALVDETKNDTAERRIAIYGTGNPMPDDPGEYIATFQMAGGDLVFHAFELPLRIWIVKNENGETEGRICRDTKEEAIEGTMKMLGKRSWPKGWYCEEETPEQRT